MKVIRVDYGTPSMYRRARGLHFESSMLFSGEDAAKRAAHFIESFKRIHPNEPISLDTIEE